MEPIDIEFDVVEHPDRWYEWRRTSAGLELKAAGGDWEPTFYKYECAALPKGTTLTEMFEDSDGATPVSNTGLTFFFDPVRPQRLWLERTQYTEPSEDPATLCETP